MGTLPDGLVTDPGERQPHGLVKIKFPAHAEKLSIFDLYTKKEYKSPFYLQYSNDTYKLKKQNIQIQGKFHITSRSCATLCFGHHQQK